MRTWGAVDNITLAIGSFMLSVDVVELIGRVIDFNRQLIGLGRTPIFYCKSTVPVPCRNSAE